MSYQFEFRPYHRRFRQPVHTHYGEWQVRDGLILKLTDEDGRSGFGEVAPLPWFGSETFEQALDFCEQLPGQLSDHAVPSLLPTLPACQFGLESVFGSLERKLRPIHLPNAQCGVLLPRGEASLESWQPLWQQGHRVFKCKIGVGPIATEMEWLDRLLGQLPLGAKLRLDANGGLNELAARQWLDWCDRNGQRIEFLEQPLPPNDFDTLMRLNYRYHTPIALDESIASLEQLKAHFHRGWDGVYIIKASIMGSPQRLQHFYHKYPIDLVISSVFETAVGRQALIRLAIDLAMAYPDIPHRALGLGTQQWFTNDGLSQTNWQQLWQRLA
ncbi:MAG: o-succinylbenzoate synthase [Cyanobacteria bacterium P01_A01_bin.15]